MQELASPKIFAILGMTATSINALIPFAAVGALLGFENCPAILPSFTTGNEAE